LRTRRAIGQVPVTADVAKNMIPFPSKRDFRLLTLVAVALQVIAMLSWLFGWILGGDAARTTLQSASYGSILPYQVVYWWGQAYPILFCIGLLFFFLFKGWSRIFLLGLLCISLALVPFSGLNVTDAMPSFLYSLANLVFWIPFLLSFFTPCSEYFNKPQNS
jgi:hypothetical protein